MRVTKLDIKVLKKYEKYLKEEERSTATIEKYMRDITLFYEFLPEGKSITKDNLLEFKQHLYEKHYKTTSINSMLVAINGILMFLNIPNLRIKLFKVQKKVFYDEGKQLTKKEYMKLLTIARSNNDDRMYALLQTICGTGIRVSEHKFITVEALKEGKAVVYNKGKERVIFITKELRGLLLEYCRRNEITTGSIFITRYGNPMDRSNIWTAMKVLCEQAQVQTEKVFPHNLRHLFALTFYRLKKDLVRLADLLGHSSIETTRIYTKTNGRECQRSLSRLDLVSLKY